MEYSEFRKSKLKTNSKKTFEITNSLGVRDAFRWIRKNKWEGLERPLTEKEFYSIIRAVNIELAKHLTSGDEIKLPQKMGRLEVRKKETFVKYEDGKLKTNRSIDWNKTLHLWFEDKEAERDKILVRREEKECFLIHYNRFNASYCNKSFYQFKPHRAIKLALKENILENSLDAYKI